MAREGKEVSKGVVVGIIVDSILLLLDGRVTEKEVPLHRVLAFR